MSGDDWTGGDGRDEVGDERPASRRHEELLRRSLAAEASTVRLTGDGLERIRTRTHSGRWRAWLVPALAGAAAIALVTAVLWGAGALGAPNGTPQPGASPSETSSPSPSPQPSGTTTPSVVPGGPRAVPVYYVGAETIGPEEAPQEVLVLFREYRPASVSDDRAEWVRSAIADMLANTSDDPDYRESLWPADVTVVGTQIDVEHATITVDLTGGNLNSVPPTLHVPAADAVANMLQQLVYTATAAAAADGTDGPDNVKVTVDGVPLTELWGSPVAEALQRDPSAVAPIWITAPTEGGTTGSPVVVTGVAALTEAQASWRLTDAGGAPVASGPFTTPEGGVRGPFTIDLGTLAPGSYTITAYDQGGVGVEGHGSIDTKTFTVV